MRWWLLVGLVCSVYWAHRITATKPPRPAYPDPVLWEHAARVYWMRWMVDQKRVSDGPDIVIPIALPRVPIGTESFYPKQEPRAPEDYEAVH